MNISKLRILSHLQDCILRYNKMVFRARCRVTDRNSRMGAFRGDEKVQKQTCAATSLQLP